MMSSGSTDPSGPSTARRWGLGCAVTAALVVGLSIGLYLAFDKPLPSGEAGPLADAVARAMMTAVDAEAWARTGAVEWDFGGRQQHLWDRDRGFVRVRWDGREVLLDLTTRGGVAREDGRELDADAAAPLLDQAWAHWVNDSFWLNPVVKVFDDGTSRALVDLEGGGQGLLVTYSSGGVTPGDSYLWALDEKSLPRRWWMWTQILPLGGVEASWEDWITLDTGARIATRHDIGLLDLELSKVRGADDLTALTGGEDPFAPLVAAR